MENDQNPAGEGNLREPSAETSPETLPADAPLKTGLLVERLLRAMKLNIDENLTSEQKLARQGMMLDSLFTSMLLAVPHPNQPYDERFNLAVALRAQKQAAQALIALELIRHRRNR